MQWGWACMKGVFSSIIHLLYGTNNAEYIGTCGETHQAVLLSVVQPMACPSCANDSLELIGFHPNDFIHTFVADREKNVIRWIPSQNKVLVEVNAQQEILTPKDWDTPCPAPWLCKMKRVRKQILIFRNTRLDTKKLSLLITCRWPRGRGNRHLGGWGCWVFSSRHQSACRTAAPCGCPMVGQPSPPQISPGWTHPSSGCHSKSTAKKKSPYYHPLVSFPFHTLIFISSLLTWAGNSLPTLLSASPVCSPSSVVPAWGPNRFPSASGGLSIS